ncbi:MAG: helix-turn-helix domain-containing protein, partial [bacterium]
MSKKQLHQIKQEVKEKELAKIRYQWFKEYKKCRNVSVVCRKYGITRSRFYYWKKRMDLRSSGKGKGYAKYLRLIAYSRKPQTNPKAYPETVIKLIKKIRKRTNRGAEYIWFTLRDKYTIYVSVTGIYKTLKREGLIKERKYKRRVNATYEAPKYLPGEKIQIDVKYVKLIDEIAKKLGKKYRWVYQYTAMDLATGIKCKMIYDHHDPQASIDFLTKVRLFYPFPIKLIQTDNGFEFTWRLHPEITKTHPFTLQCRLFGYEHYLIPPAYPRANSHVERTHRVDAEEVYRERTFTSFKSLHKINLSSLRYFNEKRPQKTKHFMSPLKF